MLGDLDRLDGWHAEEQWPFVTCPVCSSGPLAFGKSEHRLDHSSQRTLFLAGRNEAPQDELFGTFEGYLECEESSCGGEISMAGDWRLVFDPNAYRSYDMLAQFRVRYLNPTPLILRAHPDAPDEVTSAIRAASEMLLLSPSAAASRLRFAVEELMTSLGISKVGISKNSDEVRLSLDARIQQYKKLDAEVGTTLLAMKWIGNDGTHDTGLTVADVMLGAKFLDHALTKIYDKSADELLAQAKTINDNKGLPKV